MFNTGLEQTEPMKQEATDMPEPGFLHIEEKQEDTTEEATLVSTPQAALNVPVSPRAMELAGTVEHLAARRPTPELDISTPEMKQRLNKLRIAVTRLVTGFRWGGESVDVTAEQIIPLLNVGPVQQWRAALIPILFEIDRSGSMIPVWEKIIERNEPQDLPAGANPAETPLGRARRFAILMLGNYKTGKFTEQDKAVGFAKLGAGTGRGKTTHVTRLLGRLATDLNTSLYATHALVRHETTDSMQALISALKGAESWAKIDVVEACLELKQEGFYDLLVASGLDRVSGLESYIAIPIYRSIPLENYLRTDSSVSPRLSQQAALIFAQVLQDSMTPSRTDADTLPVVFERPLAAVARALFAHARSTPDWQSTYAVHRLGVFLGRYWTEVSRGMIQDYRITEPVYMCLAMMPDVERWMDGPGRDMLLSTLNEASEEEALTPMVRVLGELRDPRAFSGLVARLAGVKELSTRERALYIGTVCDALGRLGDLRAVPPLLQLLEDHGINITGRAGLTKRRDNLPIEDADIPGSIIYAAVIRACGQLGERSTLESVLRALHDLDPYVRTQAIEALKRIDPVGEDVRSRMAGRDALNDPRDTIVRSACQLISQYRDFDAIPPLHHILETQPNVALAAHEALRQMGQV